MLYIVTALYEEALPFLKQYHLKRKTDFPHFDLFAGETALLLITRPGALRAATALSSLLTAFPPGAHDFLLSAGCAGCASGTAKNKAFLLARITEGEGGRTRYPELLYHCPFPLAETITQANIKLGEPNQASMDASVPPPDKTRTTKYLPLLYDMEAAGIYEAAIPYFSCERLFFVKVVSDALTGLLELPMAARRTCVTECMEGIMPELAAWLNGLQVFFCAGQTGRPAAVLTTSEIQGADLGFSRQPSCHSPSKTAMLGTDGELFFTKVCSALHLSVTNSQQLYQLMLYLTLVGEPYLDSMEQLLAVPLAVPCRTKKEGLHYLEQLTEHYLSFAMDLRLR